MRRTVAWFAIAAMVCGGVVAAEPAEEESVVFERVQVRGTPDDPGSVTYLDAQQLERQDYSDVHRVLSQVPGVNIQEEDGYGLRPNIGMRGSGSERSSKITTMEDGVLIAPAPYAAPSAYYFPTMARMEGVEVRKGSSAIRQGPFTNGGVLNLVSSSIPSEFGGVLDVALGEDDTARGRFKVGDATERFGWLVETYRHRTDGFKRLDGGGTTGFDLEDHLVKLRFNSGAGARVFQALELKLGTTQQDGEETYLGLTQADFDADPYRRYAASQEDTLDTDHDQIVARYLVRPSPRVDVTTTVYRNDFFRNWRKLQSVLGRSLSDVLGDPGAHSGELDVLRADLTTDSADDALIVRNNRRDYYSQGVHTVVGLKPGGVGSKHEIEIGLRYHQDEEDRFQEEDGFRMTAAGATERTSLGAPGSQSNRVSTAEAFSVFVQDTIASGNWTVVPGVRFETIDFERIDYADAARSIASGRRDNQVDEWIPGVGVSYRLSDSSTLFGGVHRGFAPPGPSDSDADAEDSTNYELGYRRHAGALDADVVAFYSDYDNLLGNCTVSSGCSTADVGNVFDGGEVRVYGLEAGVRYDLAQGIPLNLAYTYTHGEFRSAFDSDYDAWGSVVPGDELPYLAQHQLSLGIGLVRRKWSAFTNLIYADAMRTVAGQGALVEADSTDAHLLLDVSGSYEWTSGLRVYAQLRNLTDEAYVAARRPAGARPGIDRTAMVGVGYRF